MTPTGARCFASCFCSRCISLASAHFRLRLHLLDRLCRFGVCTSLHSFSRQHLLFHHRSFGGFNFVPYLHLTALAPAVGVRALHCSPSMDCTRWIAWVPQLFMVPYAGPLMLWSTLMGCLDGLQGPHFFVCLCTCLHQLATWPFAQLQGPSFLPLPRWLRLLLADLWTVGLLCCCLLCACAC